MARKTMRIIGRFPDYPEAIVKPARKQIIRHSYMGALKCWVCQPAPLRWWNQNIRPATYRRHQQ